MCLYGLDGHTALAAGGKAPVNRHLMIALDVLICQIQQGCIIEPVCFRIMMPGEDHTLSTDPASPAKVSEMAIEFFAD